MGARRTPPIRSMDYAEAREASLQLAQADVRARKQRLLDRLMGAAN
jgi:hypothetical protein